MNKLAAIAVIKAASEGDEKTFTATITTNTIDRDGEVLLPQGMDARDFKKNPVVFWNHDYSIPVATATGFERTEKGWSATAKMASRPREHPQGAEWFPDTLHSLMKQGVVRGTSVGFAPIEHRAPTKKDLESFGESVRRVFSKWKLMEFSITPMPANQEALIHSVKAGCISAIQCKSLFGVDVEAIKIEPKPKRVVYFVPLAAPRVDVRKVAAQVVREVLAKRFGKMYLD